MSSQLTPEKAKIMDFKKSVARTLREMFSFELSLAQYSKRTPRELMALVRHMAMATDKTWFIPAGLEKEFAELPPEPEEIELGLATPTDPDSISGQVEHNAKAIVAEAIMTTSEAMQGALKDVQVYDACKDAMAATQTGPAIIEIGEVAVSIATETTPVEPVSEKERKRAERAKERNRDMLDRLGIYVPTPRLQLRTDESNGGAIGKDLKRLGATGLPDWFHGGRFFYEIAGVAEMSRSPSGWDQVDLDMDIKKDVYGYAERIACQSSLRAPTFKRKAGQKWDPKALPKARLGPVDGLIQRYSDIADDMEQRGYVPFGGQAGGVSMFLRMGDGKAAKSYRRVIRALSKGAEWTGYLPKFGATARYSWRNIRVEFYDSGKDPRGLGGHGEDGASWGWNVDHPDNAGLLEAHGPAVLQFFYGNMQGAYAKGDMPPVNIGLTGPRFRIADNAVKGSQKGAAKDRAKRDGVWSEKSENWLTVLRVSDKHKTQKLGYQWLTHCANTPENREIVSKLARKAIAKIAKGGIGDLLERICAQDPTAEVSRQWALKLGLSPYGIPVINNRIQARLKSDLFEAFASLGLEGQIYELLMDNRMERGTFACSWSSNRAVPAIGEDAAVWRTPHVHPQGNLLLRRVAFLDDQMVVLNGERVEWVGAIIMHPDDVAKIQGDDDGDTLAVSGYKPLVKLTENHQAAMADNSYWSFEPNAHASGEEFPHPAAIKAARHQAQGPVGLASFWHADLIALKDLPEFEGLHTAMSAVVQGCVDEMKKVVKLAAIDILSDMNEWETTPATTDDGYDRRAAPKGDDTTTKDAVEDLSNLVSSTAKDLRAKIAAHIAKELDKKEVAHLAKFTEAQQASEKIRWSKQFWKSRLTSEQGVTPRTFERAFPLAVLKFAKGAKSRKAVNFSAWKWHGWNVGKNEVDPLNWVVCGAKDGGYEWYRSRKHLPNSATLAHAAHDAACEQWWEDSNASLIREELQKLCNGEMIEFAKVFKTIADPEVPLTALPAIKASDPAKAIADKIAFWTSTPVTLRRLYKVKNGKKELMLRGEDSGAMRLTYLERDFEKQLSALIAAQASAGLFAESLGGDDDNGRSLRDASAGFKAWVTGNRVRESWEETDESGKIVTVNGPERPLTAKECLFLAIYHEVGAIVEPRHLPGVLPANANAWTRKKWQEDANAKRKARTGHVWNFLFPGSPLAEALGCRVSECDAIGKIEVEVVIDEMRGEEFPHRWLADKANRTRVVEMLNAMHVHTSGGNELIECKACSLRAKMAIADDMRDHDHFNWVATTADILNEKILRRVCFYAVDPVDGEMGQPMILGPEELAAMLASHGLQIELGKAKNPNADGTKRLWVKLAKLDSKPPPAEYYGNACIAEGAVPLEEAEVEALAAPEELEELDF